MRAFITSLIVIIISCSTAVAQKIPDNSLFVGGLAQNLKRNNRIFSQYSAENYQQWGIGVNAWYENRFNDWLALRLELRYAKMPDQQKFVSVSPGLFVQQEIGQLNFTASPLFVYPLDGLELYAGPGMGFGFVFHEEKVASSQMELESRDYESENYIAANLRMTVGANVALDSKGHHRIDFHLFADYQSNQLLEFGLTEIYPEFEMLALGAGVGYRFNFY